MMAAVRPLPLGDRPIVDARRDLSSARHTADTPADPPDAETITRQFETGSEPETLPHRPRPSTAELAASEDTAPLLRRETPLPPAPRPTLPPPALPPPSLPPFGTANAPPAPSTVPADVLALAAEHDSGLTPIARTTGRLPWIATLPPLDNSPPPLPAIPTPLTMITSPEDNLTRIAPIVPRPPPNPIPYPQAPAPPNVSAHRFALLAMSVVVVLAVALTARRPHPRGAGQTPAAEPTTSGAPVEAPSTFARSTVDPSSPTAAASPPAAPSLASTNARATAAPATAAAAPATSSSTRVEPRRSPAVHRAAPRPAQASTIPIGASSRR
jgi:hypothetical protein